MSRKDRWRRNQQRQGNDTQRGSDQIQYHKNQSPNDEEAHEGQRLGSYHVTTTSAPQEFSSPILKSAAVQAQQPHCDHLYERPHDDYTSFDSRSRRMKRRLLDCLEELEEWYPEEETGDWDHEMDWRPETEVLIPQMDVGMQWAWGHERPDCTQKSNILGTKGKASEGHMNGILDTQACDLGSQSPPSSGSSSSESDDIE